MSAECKDQNVLSPPPSGDLAELTPMVPNCSNETNSSISTSSPHLTAAVPSVSTPRLMHSESLKLGQFDTSLKAASPQQPKPRRKPPSKPKKDTDDSRNRPVGTSVQPNFAPSYMLASTQGQMFFVQQQNGQQYFVVPPYNNQPIAALRPVTSQQQFTSQGVTLPGNTTTLGQLARSLAPKQTLSGASGQNRAAVSVATNRSISVSQQPQTSGTSQNSTQQMTQILQPTMPMNGSWYVQLPQGYSLQRSEMIQRAAFTVPSQQQQSLNQLPTPGLTPQSNTTVNHDEQNGSNEKSSTGTISQNANNCEAESSTPSNPSASEGQSAQLQPLAPIKPNVDTVNSQKPNEASTKIPRHLKQPSTNKPKSPVKLPAPRPIAPTNLVQLPLMLMGSFNGQNIPVMTHPHFITGTPQQPFINVFQQQRFAVAQPTQALRVLVSGACLAADLQAQATKHDENGDLGLENEPPPLLAQSDAKDAYDIQQLFAKEAVKFGEKILPRGIIKHNLDEYEIEEANEPFPVDDRTLDIFILQSSLQKEIGDYQKNGESVQNSVDVAEMNGSQATDAVKKVESAAKTEMEDVIFVCSVPPMPLTTGTDKAGEEVQSRKSVEPVQSKKNVEAVQEEVIKTDVKSEGQTAEGSVKNICELDKSEEAKSSEDKLAKGGTRRNRKKVSAQSSKAESIDTKNEKKDCSGKKLRKRKTNELDRLLQMDFGPSQGRLCDIMSGTSLQLAKKSSGKLISSEENQKNAEKGTKTTVKTEKILQFETTKSNEGRLEGPSAIVHATAPIEPPHEDVMEKFIVEDGPSTLQSADAITSHPSSNDTVVNNSDLSKSSGSIGNHSANSTGLFMNSDEEVDKDRCYYCNGLLRLKRLENHPQYCSKKCRKLWKKNPMISEEQVSALMKQSSSSAMSSSAAQTSPNNDSGGTPPCSRPSNSADISADSSQTQERSPTTLTLKKISSEKAEIVSKPTVSSETNKGLQPSTSTATDEQSSMEFIKKSATLWTCDEVSKWVNVITGNGDVASIFQKEEIDGQSLLLIAENPHHNLGELMGLKLGPMVKIIKALRNLDRNNTAVK